ncbi:hypothetical protein ASD64_20120 [Mesorhizobium sp. Root157]|nr:hypothetical protein ASD64_20120 [Mesorhizobium sp. Root157]
MICLPATLRCLLQGEPDVGERISARRTRSPRYAAGRFQRATDPGLLQILPRVFARMPHLDLGPERARIVIVDYDERAAVSERVQPVEDEGDARRARSCAHQ